MKRTCILLLLSAFFLGLSGVSAQNNTPKNLQKSKNNPANYRDADGHELIFNIKDSKDTLVYLVIHYNDKLILKDSVKPAGKGKFVFKGTDRYDDGMYSLVSMDKKLYLNFILDNNQHFTYNLDTTMDVNNFSVVNSSSRTLRTKLWSVTLKEPVIELSLMFSSFPSLRLSIVRVSVRLAGSMV